MIFSNFFRVKPKDVVLDKTCKQQTWFLEPCLQSEAAECGPSCLEAGFGKLASKVDLPQGAGSREAPWRA